KMSDHGKPYNEIVFPLPDELRRHGVFRIAKQGTDKKGWICSVRCCDKRTDPPKDVLAVFGIAKTWEKTLSNFDTQMDGKLDPMTKEMIRFFILDNRSKLQYDITVMSSKEEK